MFIIAETNLDSHLPVTESGTLVGALMRGMAEIWRWSERSPIDEVVQYTKGEQIRLVPKSDGVFWDSFITIAEFPV